MTPSHDPLEALPDASELDGHTVDEVSEYFDRGMEPPDPSIDQSPGCQIVLSALARLREISSTLLESEARAEAVRDESWIERILNQIGLEARSGREIPFEAPGETGRLGITEGAVRGLIRSAGDSTGDAIVGRCRLEGDVTLPGEPITVMVDVSVFWGSAIPETIAAVREAIYGHLRKHTELNIVSVDITVHDIQSPDE